MNVTVASSARVTLLIHTIKLPWRNALKNATTMSTASGSPLKRTMITASSMRSARTSLTVILVLVGRRNVPMDIKVTN